MSDLLEIKGIGKALETRLHEENIRSIGDLVETFPVRYVFHSIDDIADARLDTFLTLSGEVETAANVFYIRRRLTKLVFDFVSGSMHFSVAIFNREFLKNTINKGDKLVISGKFIQDFRHFTASDIVKEARFKTGIIPEYDIGTLSSHQLHKLILQALTVYQDKLREQLPEYLIERHMLPKRKEFIGIVHQPLSMEDVKKAQKRIKYEELLGFALQIEAIRKLGKRVVKKPKVYDIEVIRDFIHRLPFELTHDQKEATNQIFRDFKRKQPMNRLLQGDVGSGKTILVVIAALAVFSAGSQTAFMAPTEILAYQHYQTFRHYLGQEGVEVAYLSRNVTKNERQAIIEGLKAGKIDVIIGTHALIQDDLFFHDLGFVVIDEQHRFGVRQRRILRKKGITPDVLFMSATPIPRTLAITLFKDMDISSIHTLPEGRKKIVTEIIGYEEMSLAYEKTRNEIASGKQAYFILPLIHENDRTKLLSVEEFVKQASVALGEQAIIGVLHGKMSAIEKVTTLEAFRDKRINVLVSTTVVEVGMNVPDATVMVVLNANHFGLSQLHQLRGRVGRSSFQAHCYLVVDDLSANRDKLEILEKSNDGFVISEVDLEQRGPGEVFGEEQTGIPRFRMANIVLDRELLELAMEDAGEIMANTDIASQVLTRKAFASIDAYNLD